MVDRWFDFRPAGTSRGESAGGDGQGGCGSDGANGVEGGERLRGRGDEG